MGFEEAKREMEIALRIAEKVIKGGELTEEDKRFLESKENLAG